MLEAELDVASGLAREAGRILLEIYATDFSVACKGRADPVTEADRLANALLVRELRARFPGDGIVAEESPITAMPSAGSAAAGSSIRSTAPRSSSPRTASSRS